MTATSNSNSVTAAYHRPMESTVQVAHLGADRLFAGTTAGRVGHSRHRALTGAAPHRDRTWLIDAAHRVGLRGRGGAGFPVADKLAAVAPGRRTHVLVNGSESDPTSSKDKALLCLAPHHVVDGALLVAAALQTDRITIVVPDPVAADSLTAACDERGDAARYRIVTRTGHSVVSGEVHALIEALDGRPAVPTGRRVSASRRGIGKAPTFASNVETFAQLGLLAGLGVDRFAELGFGPERGTMLMTTGGAVPFRAVAEVPVGTRLSRLTGPTREPVLLGGYHGAWTTELDIPLDHRFLHDRHLGRGVGSVVVLPTETCALGEIARVVQWSARRSAGQCGPCVFGLDALAADMTALARGERRDPDAIRRRLGVMAGRGSCNHPDGVARFAASALTRFGHEVDAHLRGGCGRRILGVLPIPDDPDDPIGGPR
ncbi:NADH-ubiquinone oxidoreductase-F iron-sulfur binding region domain-containing protein [Gordonia sp. NB41Y]|uniref:NADH-ubiquinone oxidoreductase-F iron-sulfur binding region domain-containing protein n=1 Tax=Gordonia sp. NB41Y TaxID=875808 RepID=UPI0006B19D11|nr:NADH-ubiquinone oxidoreductase-F iron-sulfur binding region domain-containing protein [Gordonia sp. NB41Y]WLP89397.1 NADH-ubiquinone oxidoreductase-F iron-sulfur binding region domain-containing protein [Gordonia sp. NB41Y]